MNKVEVMQSFYNSILEGMTFLWDSISERPNHSGSGSVRPNLDVRWGSAEPPNLQVRSTEPPPNQITT